MVLVGVVDEAAAHALVLQGVEQLDPVVVGHAVVEGPVDDEGRRLEVRRAEVRRHLPVESVLLRVPELAEALLLRAVVGAVLRVEVVDGGVRDQGLEGVGPPEDERRQVAPVAAAAGRHALAVDPGLPGEPVRRGDRVLVRLGGPVGVDRVGEGLAEARGAVEVVPRAHVAPAREDLGVPAEGEGVLDAVVGPAVEDQVERVLLRGVEARRVDDPHLDVTAPGALVGHALVAAPGHPRQQLVVEGRDLRGLPGARGPPARAWAAPRSPRAAPPGPSRRARGPARSSSSPS